MATVRVSSPLKPRLIFGHDPPIVFVSDYEFDLTVQRVP
jgi:hypothetical protein